MELQPKVEEEYNYEKSETEKMKVEIIETEEESPLPNMPFVKAEEKPILSKPDLKKEKLVRQTIYKNSEYSPDREKDYVYFKVSCFKSFAEKGII